MVVMNLKMGVVKLVVKEEGGGVEDCGGRVGKWNCVVRGWIERMKEMKMVKLQEERRR